ncbi:mammalian cell entry protein [Mycolicibacterium madagascariense]|jgi:phospholipid/cholesterol/gamma-HCH transport system substrate-binding protein|uniref:Mammalian cell entry protein n=1 Tax=Mycolicibacterium madagascariense TaxID=212765 RepID=A0A7I7XK65_9MYCO|nr:MCE family protein [Mycolicibacterium madagascariense]MCV7012095.1 MCE family protein [Mycolicibacterium madagascariense]BBZ29604.1 mammalian cell entry protein [Mycolicibacterium madagascariense]
MSGSRGMLVKFLVFATIMSVLTVFLFFTFGQYRTGSTNGYSAVFTDASRLKSGDTVRVAGIRVGTVTDVSLRSDHEVLVDFDADRSLTLTSGTKAAIRYLNLTGDRYLELADGPGSTRLLPPGSQIPVDRTQPALDLDLLLSGLKPVVQGLNPQDVNALTASLVQVFQGEGDTLDSLLSKTSSFSSTIADDNETVQSLIDNLNTVLGTVAKNGDQFSGTIDRLEKLISGLSADRDPIGTAITSLDNGTASLADLLTQARPPLAGVVNQLNRLAPNLQSGKGYLDGALQRAPGNYRKLARIGAYGSFVQYYICEISIRVTDLQGRASFFPFIKQENGRCAEP